MRTSISLAIASAALLAGTHAHAQLTPAKACYGANRPITVTVAVPEGAAGDATIALFVPATGEQAHESAAKAGDVDLAALFPSLWDRPTPRPLYAQLIVGGTRVGSPLVLQPMTSPAVARLTDPRTGAPYTENPRTGQPNFPPQNGRISIDPPRGGIAYSGLRVYTAAHVLFDTTQGEVEIRLRPDIAPNTAWNFRELVRQGFYDDVLFHRIVNKPDQRFVVQSGDPTGTGTGGPGFNIDLESTSALPHDYGVLSMARASDPNSAGSQFFICLSREATQPLDGKYAAFGEVVRGMAAVNSIAAFPVDPNDRPTGDNPPTIRSATLIPAPPFGEGPGPEKPETSEGQPR